MATVATKLPSELEQLRRLHEVATERTVQLAAVIEQARKIIAAPRPNTTVGTIDDALAGADTGAALSEVRANAWDEGMQCALDAAEDTTDGFGNLYRIDWQNRMEHEREQNPYREDV